MSFNKDQFKALIEETLKEIDMYSPAAVNLLLGTAAQESEFGTYIKQVGSGPAVGAFQIEPATHKDNHVNWLKFRVNLFDRIIALTGCSPAWYHIDSLLYNLKYSIIQARIKYYRAPGLLPEKDDVAGMAAYWKRYYNTEKGKGTEEEFVVNYFKYVE